MSKRQLIFSSCFFDTIFVAYVVEYIKILQINQMLVKWRESNIIAYCQIILACFIWGSYGLFIRFINYPPELIVFFRFFLASVTLIFFAILTGKFSQLKTPKWKWLVLIGVINTISWLTLTKSVVYTSVANSFILYYTAPCFVILLAPLFLKEKIEKRSLVALIMSFAGIICIVGLSGFSQGTDVWQGNLMGLASGFCYALYIIGLKYLPQHVLGLVSNIYVCTTIACITLPLAIGYMHLITPDGLLLLLLMALFIQVIATTLYMLALRKVRAQHAGIICYSEALFAMIFAAILLNEGFTLGLVVGTVLIIGGGLLIMTRKPTQNSTANSKELPS